MSEVVQDVKRKQSQVNWIDLKSADPETKLVAVKFPSSVVRLVLVTKETLSDEQDRVLSEMGFYRTPSELLVRDDLKFTLPVIRKAFPAAVPVQVSMNEVTRIMRDRAPAGEGDGPGDRGSAVSIKNTVMTAKPLGTNHLNQAVYQGEDGRFVKDVDGQVVREGGSVVPAVFLYARTPEDLALCAEGFVGEIAGGKVMRAEDLKRFASVVMELQESEVTSSSRFREAQEAIEAALVRYMQKHAGPQLDRGVFALAQRLEEGQPAFTARTSDSVTLQQYSTPITMSVAVQRIVGDAGGLDVLDPTIGNGSLVFSMADSNIIGCDLDPARLANVARARPDSTLAVGDATTIDLRELNDNKPYDVILANPPFGGLNVGRTLQGLKITRIDHLILMRSLLARSEAGLGVFIIGADSYLPGKAGQVSGGSRYLFNWLADHYQVDAVEVDGRLFSKQGAGYPVRILVVGKKGRSATQIPDQLEVLRDHEQLFDWSTSMRMKYGAAPEVTVVPAPVPSMPDGAEAVPVGQPNTADQDENSYQSPYAAFSRASEATAMIPRNLATPTRMALTAVVEESGDIDGFVAGELGWSVSELGQYLSPEQVDAVALAINSVRKERGFLEADQTGLGKGRVMASLARYAALNQLKTVFLTETPTLFTDLWRDICDIGSEDLFQPLIVNEGVSVYDPISGRKLISATPKPVIDRALAAGGIPDGYNLVLGTYSQFNRDRATSAKARWISDIAQGSALLLDEAHNAAGESNTGSNIGLAIEQASYVIYSSATSMKAGRNVMLYSKLFPNTVDMGALPETLATGGEVLQEVLSGMLAGDGVFVRREHDLSNLTFRTVVDAEREQRNRDLSDRLAEILELMNYLAGDISQLVNERNKEIKKLLGSIPEAERKGNRMGAINPNFGSRLFAIYRQFMMAIKVDLAAERAIMHLEQGRKPVIVLENTMESLLTDLALGARPDVLDPDDSVDGDSIGGLLRGEVELGSSMTFRDVLHRMLNRLTYFCETGRYGNVSKVPITSAEALDTVASIADLIDAFPDLPVSPLDDIRQRIIDAGFTCDELSGRKLQVHERDGTIVAVPVIERPKAQIVKDFVTGNSDALLLTGAGSTGISLHASEKFPDQRQRVMIELQTAADVNRRVQFAGRVNRKGQTSSPEIETLASGLIGEARPIAMQNAKLRKLSANTTANQDNAALDKTVPDFINSIGDEVAYRFLEANPAIARRLDIDMDNEDDRQESYFINKLTSRLVMLRVIEQEQIYEALTNEYHRVIKELDAKGVNPLRSRELDVRAKEISRVIYESGDPNSESSFNRPVFARTIEYETKVDPMRSAEVMQRVNIGAAQVKGFKINEEDRENKDFFLALKGYLASNRSRFLSSVKGKEFASVDDALAAKKPNAVQKMLQRLHSLDEALNGLYVGAVARFSDNEDATVFGVVVSVSVPENPKHIHLLGAYELGFAVPGRQGIVERTLYSLQSDAQFRLMPQGAMYRELMVKFDSAPAGVVVSRRMILDGNLFKAAQIAATNSLGSSVIYTDETGFRHRGVLLARGVDMDDLKNLPVRVETARMCDLALTNFADLELTTSTNVTYDETRDLKLYVQDGRAVLEVPGSKSRGGQYFSDEELVKWTGPFAGTRSCMTAKFPRENVEKVTSNLYRRGVSFYIEASYRDAINELKDKTYTNESCIEKPNNSRIGFGR